MNIKKILKKLEYNTGEFPGEAIQEAIEKKTEIIPELLKILEYTSKNVKYVIKKEKYFAHIYAMFLLAQFREKKAYPLIVSLVSHRGEIPFDLLGDVVTEDLCNILASVSCADITLIKKIVENRKLDEFVRNAALQSLLTLVACGKKSREEIMDYYKSLCRGKLERQSSALWDGLVRCCYYLHPGEVYEDIVQAYEDHLVSSFYISLDDVQENLFKTKEEVLQYLKQESRYKLIEDTISCLNWWACFNKSEEFNDEELVESFGILDKSYRYENLREKPKKVKKIGRNDPCPCGSGKKYKKCCLIKASSGIGIQELKKTKLIKKLEEFSQKYYKESIYSAYEFFWNGVLPEDNLPPEYFDFTTTNFWEWYILDCKVEEDKTLIDTYIQHNKQLSSFELEVLLIMCESVISLYEVQEVFPDRGLLLKDLIFNREYEVREKKATYSLNKWDIIATRLLYLDSKYIMSGSVYPFPVGEKQRLIKTVYNVFKNYKERYPEGNIKDMLKLSGNMFNDIWYHLACHPIKPIFVTTDKEPLIFSKAVFGIKDKEKVIQGLKSITMFRQIKANEFTWSNRPDQDGATILGRIEIKGKKLMLECNSRERLKKGKRIILKAIPKLVLHKIDTFQDPYKAIESQKDKPLKESEIPMEIQQKLYFKFMKEHMEKWFNENIPALDGKTPMEGVKTKEGREKVIDLLKLYENSEERNKKEGKPYYDFSWVWKRLNLDKDS